jgi:hypothetical protein
MTTLLTAGLLVASSNTAHAVCDYSWSWEFFKIHGVHKPFPGNKFKDGPGGQMTVRVEKSSTVERSVSATLGVSGGPPLVAIKAEVTAGARSQKTATLGHEYSHKVSRGKFGHLSYGSWAKHFRYRKIGRAPFCPNQVVARGAATYPTRFVGWRYWETTS